MNVYEWIIVLIIILYLGVSYKKYLYSESFEGYNENNYYINAYSYENIYDELYSFIYDDLFYQEQYYILLSKVLLKYLNNVYNNHLCIGIKHGGHINELLNKNMKTKSISKSEATIRVCKHRYSDNTYQQIKEFDTNPYIFDENTFTHISIIDNEIYYLQDIQSLFYNTYKWLILKGYLIIPFYHNKSDLKKGFLKLANNSNVRINTIYSTNFKEYSTNEQQLLLVEKINEKGKIRTNNHSLYFYKKEYIEFLGKQYNFNLITIEPFTQYESIFIFQKN